MDRKLHKAFLIPLISFVLSTGSNSFLGNAAAADNLRGVVSKGASAPGGAPAPTAGAANPAVARAIGLFQSNQFAAAADAFEPLLTGASPRILYYAALSNQQCSRTGRAKQLAQHIIDTFPNTTEAKYAQVLMTRLPSASVSTASAAPPKDEIDAMSERAKKSLPKEMQAMLETPEGKLALRQSTEAAIQNARGAAPATTTSTVTTTTSVTTTTGTPSKTAARSATPVKSDHPFTADDIARDGANGIDQSRYPNCWFEASLSSLAALPRGQRLIASMIKQIPGGSYVVRFPNDGNEYFVTNQNLVDAGLRDNALWAAILECAELRKYPDNVGTEGLNRLEVGLSCISGLKAEVLDPSNVTEAEMSSFIGGPIRSQNPIVCATGYLGTLPDIVFPTHAYTIVDFDPSKKMITLRNPHGRRAKSFDPLPDDPQQLHFQQLPAGVCKMDLATFQKYFRMAARSFI